MIDSVICQKCGSVLDYEVNDEEQVEISPCSRCLDEFIEASQQVNVEEAFEDVFRVMEQAGKAAVENWNERFEKGD